MNKGFESDICDQISLVNLNYRWDSPLVQPSQSNVEGTELFKLRLRSVQYAAPTPFTLELATTAGLERDYV